MDLSNHLSTEVQVMADAMGQKEAAVLQNLVPALEIACIRQDRMQEGRLLAQIIQNSLLAEEKASFSLKTI